MLVDKKFGGAVVYYPIPKRKLDESVIPVKAIDVSDPKKIKLVSIKVSRKECEAFKKAIKPICDMIKEDMIKACKNITIENALLRSKIGINKEEK